MDFETVRFLRVVFAFVAGLVGAAGGLRYFGTLGAIGGLVVGLLVGWNLVDLVKGRPQK